MGKTGTTFCFFFLTNTLFFYNFAALFTTEMKHLNYYLSKGPELIDHFVPDGRYFITAKYEGNYYVGIEGRTDNYFHELIIKFGILHCAGPEE